MTWLGGDAARRESEGRLTIGSENAAIRLDHVILERSEESQGSGGRALVAEYYVYIMTNKSKTLYIGVTSDLFRRVYEHKQKLVEGFAKRYNVATLAYYESTTEIESAIARENRSRVCSATGR